MPDAAPQISDAEWEVVKVVWEAADAAGLPPTAGEVVQRMAAAGGPGARWRPRTIKTLLSRLVQKGAVRADAEPGGAAKVYRYRPAVSREACVRQESRSFLRRVFDGDVAPALVHLLKASNLSRDEIERLKKLLDDEAAANTTKKAAGKGRAS